MMIPVSHKITNMPKEAEIILDMTEIRVNEFNLPSSMREVKEAEEAEEAAEAAEAAEAEEAAEAAEAVAEQLPS